MKLSNKKTRDIYTLGKNLYINTLENGKIEVVRILSDGKLREYYETIAKFFENYEDVEEPIIKDEKIRKFLRAWADMNGVSDIIVFDKSNSPYITDGQVVFAENAGSLRVYFRTDEQFDTNRIYTVNELCGDDE